jgi:hypothetical protein
MPIEIRELIIRTQVTDEGAAAGKSADNARSYSQKEIIERCVEKILRILHKKTER